MKAAVLVELQKDLRVVDNVTPRPLRNGQLRVKIFYSGVCMSQVMEWQGARGPDKFLPHLLGHEATGEVLEVHPSVSKVRVGDLVVLGWIKGDGIEAGGALYDHPEIGTINSGGVTTFSTETVVSENRVVKLPSGIEPDVGVLFGCALLTGAGMVLNQAKPPEGSTICVIGAGGIGMSAVIAAALTNPKKLVVCDHFEEKLSLAKDFGATHTINTNNENWKQLALQCLEQKDGFDFAIEAAGTTKTIEDAFELTRPRGGQCIFASHPPEGEKISLEPHKLHLGKSLSGSWGGLCIPDRDIPKIAKMILDKGIPLRRLMSGPYLLEDITAVLEKLKKGSLLRPVLKMETTK